MIWLTWRQHRGETFVIGGVLAALVVLLIVTGRELYAAFDRLGVAGCLAARFDSNCPQIIQAFGNQFDFLRFSVPWLNLVPVLVAMLVGAPLVARELEHGTHRLVWTQGVTRLRWLAVNVGLIVVGCILAEAILVALLTWWRGPFTRLGGSLTTEAFDLEGTAPLAYMAFALAAAIAAGTLLRRALPAMVLTLALFLAVRLPVDNLVRPHYEAPITQTYDLATGDEGIRTGDWVIDDGFVTASGAPADFSQLVSACDPYRQGLEKQTFFQCAQAHGFRGQIVYQPANRLTRFQASETLLYLALTALLLGLTVYWVRRRVS
jgi:hypothetical protein